MFKYARNLAQLALLALPLMLICPCPSQAALPPLSAEHRQQNSSAIVTATVLGLETNKVGVKAGGYDILTTAKVRIETVEKGELQAGKTIEVHYRQTGKRPRGWAGPQGQNQALSEGSTVRLYLDQTFGAYHLLSPNGWDAIKSETP
jgi:hypothetical protein